MSCILMLQHPTKMIRNHGQGKEYKLYKSKVLVSTLPKIRNLNNDRELKSAFLRTKMKVIKKNTTKIVKSISKTFD